MKFISPPAPARRFSFPGVIAAGIIIAAMLTAGARAQVISAPAAMQRLLRRAARNELRFQQARARYSYRRRFSFFELSNRFGQRGGLYRSTTDITYSNRGKPLRRRIGGGVNDLKFLRLDRGDRYDLRHILPLVLTPTRLELYYCRYLGRETIRLRNASGKPGIRLRAARFRISPLQIWPKQRYFHGSIWIDPRTAGLVKISGRPVPDYLIRRHGEEKQHLFGRFTTWFVRRGGRWWFPVYSAGEDWLGFRSGGVQVREVVRYSRYKKFIVRHRIQILKPH